MFVRCDCLYIGLNEHKPIIIYLFVRVAMMIHNWALCSIKIIGLVVCLLVGGGVEARDAIIPGWVAFQTYTSTITNKLHQVSTNETNTRLGLGLAYDPNYGVDIDMYVYDSGLSSV